LVIGFIGFILAVVRVRIGSQGVDNVPAMYTHQLFDPVRIGATQFVWVEDHDCVAVLT
jgi:hypothetical protein